MDHDPIQPPEYFRNEHGALIMRAVYRPATLDERGRCCGRKPMVYKRPAPHFFCPRCNREFTPDGCQHANWAFKLTGDGLFVCDRPIPRDEEAKHLEASR